MKKIITFIALASMLNNAFAQKINLSAKGGYQINNYNDNWRYTAKPENGITFGVGGEVQLNHFLLSVEGIYEIKGFSYLIEAGGSSLKSTYKTSYISTPVKAGWQFGRKVFAVAYIGATPSFILDSKVNSSYSSGHDEKYDNSKNATSFGIAGLAEIGGGYQLSKRIGVIATVRHNVSFNELWKDPNNKSNGKFQSTAILIGARFTL